MAHLIKENDNVVLAKEKAWHNLGLVDPREGIPMWEAFKLAGALWDVGTYQPYIKMPDGREVPIEDTRYTVREDTGLVLGQVSPDYVAISNRQVGQFCEDLMDANFVAEAKQQLPKALRKQLGDEILVETLGTLDNCRRFWLLLQIPGYIDIGGMTNERMKFYLLATTTHGKSYTAGGGFEGFHLKGTGTRVVCDNTATAALYGPGASAVVRHIGDVDSQIAEARKSLGLTFKFIGDFAATAETLLDRKMTPDRLDHFLKALVPIPVARDPQHPKPWIAEEARRVTNLREKIGEVIATEPDLAEIRGTDYAALQGVAAYERHHRRFVKSEAASVDERRFATIMGESNAVTLTTRAGKILTGQKSGNALLDSQLDELLAGF